MRIRPFSFYATYTGKTMSVRYFRRLRPWNRDWWYRRIVIHKTLKGARLHLHGFSREDIWRGHHFFLVSSLW